MVMEKKATYSYAERPGKHYNAAYGTFYDARWLWKKVHRQGMVFGRG